MLKERLARAAKGRISPTDSIERICQDALTDLLRMEEQLHILDQFREFMRGYINSPSNDLPESHITLLHKRLKSTDNDLKRGNPDRSLGCC